MRLALANSGLGLGGHVDLLSSYETDDWVPVPPNMPAGAADLVKQDLAEEEANLVTEAMRNGWVVSPGIDHGVDSLETRSGYLQVESSGSHPLGESFMPAEQSGKPSRVLGKAGRPEYTDALSRPAPTSAAPQASDVDHVGIFHLKKPTTSDPPPSVEQAGPSNRESARARGATHRTPAVHASGT